MDSTLHLIEQDLAWLESAGDHLEQAACELLARHAAFTAWLDARGL
jgi:hypothetical protein